MLFVNRGTADGSGNAVSRLVLAQSNGFPDVGLSA